MVDKTQIEELLGSGLSNEVVASAVGCDPSYISQLLSDEAFHTRVVARRTTNLQQHSLRDSKLDNLEDALISKLEDIIISGVLYKPHDLFRAFQLVNSAKRRGIQAQQAPIVQNTVVNIRLPEAVKTRFVMTGSSEVVEIDGKTLITLPSKDLFEQAGISADNTARGSSYDRARQEALPKYGGLGERVSEL